MDRELVSVTDIDTFLQHQEQEDGGETPDTDSEAGESAEERTPQEGAEGDEEEGGESEDGGSQDDDESDESDEDDDLDEDEDEDEDEEGEEETLEAVVAPKPGKPVKAVTKDGELEIPTDAKMKVKVNGEFVEASVREILDSYSSSRENQRVASQLQNQSREIQSKIEQYDNVLTHFTELATQGRAVEAFSHLLEASGKDALPVIRQIRKELVENAQAYLSMSEEEKKVFEAREESLYYQSRLSARDQAARDQQSLQEVGRQVQAAMQKYNIPTQEDFRELYFEAKDWGTKQGLDESQIDAEYVGQFATLKRQSELLFSTLDEVSPDLKQDPEVVARLAKAISAFNPSKEELRRVVKSIYAQSEQKSEAVAETSKKKLSSKPLANKTPDEFDVDPGLDIDKTPSVRSWSSR